MRCPGGSALTSTTSFASDALSVTAETQIQKALIEPLADKEQNQGRFTRGRQPVQARRIRLLDSDPLKDADGKAFVTFAVDARRGRDTLTGCVYPGTGAVFVLRSGVYYPAASMLGKKTKPAAKNTCMTDAAQVASAK